MSETFVSYSRVDMPFAKELRSALVERGHRVWLDVTELRPSDDWLETIERAIEGATSFVFVVSPESLRSTMCMHELRYALTHGKRIVALVRRSPDGQPIPDELGDADSIAAEGEDVDAVVSRLVAML